MGEVFKAWDPRLERDVAIKLLHAETAGDPDRQRRLVAEGRAASALNHPNILRVYDADVDWARRTTWCRNGSTATRCGTSCREGHSRSSGCSISRSRSPTAWRAAHASGIVHRDIKPENIMLARDGTARIVDFGLARSDPRAPGMATVAGQAATVTASLDGGLSGTPAYMSPEQARGTAGDFRTDQFSFGALLYEMATGKHAFRRDTMADTLAAVLHDEPRPIAEQNPRIPSVGPLDHRALPREGRRRTLLGDRRSGARAALDPRSPFGGAESSPSRRPAASRGLRAWKLIAAAAVAAVAGALVVIGMMSLSPKPAPIRFVPFASASSYEGEPSWSPDGQSLAYTADVDGVLQVFVKRVGDALSRPLTSGQFDASHPFWTRNGERVYYISQAGEYEALWSVGVAGGRPELELENVSRAAIDADGTRLALLRIDPDAAMRQTLWWSSPPGAPPQREQRPPFDTLRTGGDGLVRFSADGQLMAWMYDVDTINSADPSRSSGFYLVPPGTGAGRAGPDRPAGRQQRSAVRLVDRQPAGLIALPDASGGQPAFVDRRHRVWSRPPDYRGSHQRNRAGGGAGRFANRLCLGGSRLRSHADHSRRPLASHDAGDGAQRVRPGMVACGRSIRVRDRSFGQHRDLDTQPRWRVGAADRDGQRLRRIADRDTRIAGVFS